MDVPEDGAPPLLVAAPADASTADADAVAPLAAPPSPADAGLQPAAPAASGSLQPAATVRGGLQLAPPAVPAEASAPAADTKHLWASLLEFPDGVLRDLFCGAPPTRNFLRGLAATPPAAQATAVRVLGRPRKAIDKPGICVPSQQADELRSMPHVLPALRLLLLVFPPENDKAAPECLESCASLVGACTALEELSLSHLSTEADLVAMAKVLPCLPRLQALSVLKFIHDDGRFSIGSDFAAQLRPIAALTKLHLSGVMMYACDASALLTAVAELPQLQSLGMPSLFDETPDPYAREDSEEEEEPPADSEDEQQPADSEEEEPPADSEDEEEPPPFVCEPLPQTVTRLVLHAGSLQRPARGVLLACLTHNLRELSIENMQYATAAHATKALQLLAGGALTRVRLAHCKLSGDMPDAINLGGALASLPHLASLSVVDSLALSFDEDEVCDSGSDIDADDERGDNGSNTTCAMHAALLWPLTACTSLSDLFISCPERSFVGVTASVGQAAGWVQPLRALTTLTSLQLWLSSPGLRYQRAAIPLLPALPRLQVWRTEASLGEIAVAASVCTGFPALRDLTVGDVVPFRDITDELISTVARYCSALTNLKRLRINGSTGKGSGTCVELAVALCTAVPSLCDLQLRARKATVAAVAERLRLLPTHCRVQRVP